MHLAHETLENVEPITSIQPLGPKNLHSEKFSSMEKEMIEHKSHDQPPI